MEDNELGLRPGNAICYSGYRDGQSPADGIYPAYREVHEDLEILSHNWRYLRLFDSSPHARLALDVIRKEKLDLKVMLSSEMRAEVSNPNCPWGADYSDEQLADNRRANSEEVDRLIEMAGTYSDIVFSLSVGNEATADWTDHMVPVKSLIDYVRRIKATAEQPVTFCENYVPWTGKLQPLAEELDFLSLHTYPVWEYRSVEEAMDYSRSNYHSVADRYPDKPVIITEAGWTTNSNGRGIDPGNASQHFQDKYFRELTEWSRKNGILTFVFEAFDEPWKGSPDPMEPEKHWGLFTVERKPKLVMQDLYSHLHREDE